MKKSMTTVFFALLVLTIFVGAAAKVDFTGTWVLDKSRTEGLPPGMDQTLTITQTGDRLDAVFKLTGEQGEQTITDRYVLDGKETEFTPPVIGGNAERKGKRTSKLTADGNAFDVTEEATLETAEGDATIKATRRWSLAPDGKTLTIEMSLDGPSGTTKSKRVFVKK